jgi:hypothetical protein
VSLDDESYLELDAAEPPRDPTPELPLTADDEAFLEVSDDPAALRVARGRVVTDDDLRMVNGLADDAVPLLAALWPAVTDLLAELPTLDAFRARVALARTTLNQVTRRGAEWRARAEVAGAALTRRLDALRRGAHRTAELDEPTLRAACDDLRAWHERALSELLRAEAAGTGKVYADGVRRVGDEARRRGLDDAALRALTARLGVELLPGEVAPWTPCTVLSGAPRTLDGVASALVNAPAQGVAALRDGSLVTWMRANRCPDVLAEAAAEAQRLAEGDDPVAGVWWLVWALGRDGVTVDGHTVTAPETLLAHLRTARLHLSRVATVGTVLGRWFRLKGHNTVAAACEALARGDAHAGQRLRWALGEPLRLGERTVTEPAGLVREVLTRPAARAAALDAWRDGTLRAWLDTLPRAKRDALWLDDLARPPAHDLDETSFWRGVYRRAPKTALRVALDGAEGQRGVRFQTVADLHATARVAALWGPLKSLLRTGELRAWLAAAAPGIELDGVGRGANDDVALHEVLAAVGHTGVVLPRGRAGFPVTAPANLVTAWRRGWQQVEALLAHGHIGAWLARYHPGEGPPGVTAERAVAAWGPTLGAGTAPPGVAALRLALLCGLDELPADPQRPVVRGFVRGYRKVDVAGRDPEAWEALLGPSSPHRAHGTVLLWMARHIPAFGVLVTSALGDATRTDDCGEAITAAGVPVATEALATERVVAERESARLAAEREAATLASEREAATVAAEREAARLAEEREKQRLGAERDAVRREVDREIQRLTAERDAARVTLERELARVTAERELARLEGERAVAKILTERDAVVREAERSLAGLARERDEAKLDAERRAAKATAERDEARLEAERARLERDIAKLETDQMLRRIERARELGDQQLAEREATRLHRLEAERQAAIEEERRLRALEAACREEAEREAARAGALETAAQQAAALEATRLAAAAAEAQRTALAEQQRLAAFEEEARQEAARRAEEAARRAEEAAAMERRLADEAQRREATAQEAEELAQRLVHEREAAREAAWSARKVAAQRELARLAAKEAEAQEAAAQEAARIAAREAEAREVATREAARMAALAEEAHRMALAEQDRLAALEEEARREAGRRAEEAASLAQRLAEEARRREVAEREAEELARRLVLEREAAREASWAARKVAAEREIARLAEAERRARDLAAELSVPETADATTGAAIETLTEIEGALDEAPDARDLAAVTVEDLDAGLPERREIRHEALVDAQPLDEAALARVRAAVLQWARASGRTTDHGEAPAVEITEAVARPAFEVHATARMESRTLSFVKPPWREDDVVPVPPEAAAPGASVDPWALELPELDVWTSWRGDFLLDTAPIKTRCAACDDGITACAKCDGAGDRPCPSCDGRAKVRCPRCAGAGEVAGERGVVRCEACEGRRDIRCPGCSLGRALCPACRGSKRARCPTCRGVGELVERVAVTQEYQGVAAVSVVGSGIPEAVLACVQARDADPLPVIHVEAAEIDAFALARELTHGPLGESVAQSLADEAARAAGPWRLTRQRLVVRRYPTAEVRCTVAGEGYTLWVHGARDAVHAASSPKSRRVETLVGRANDAVVREDVDGAVEILRTLQELCPDDPAATRTAVALGELVLAMAHRGELFAAREAAVKARSLRWAGCVAKLVEAERVLGSRLQVRAPWALAEEARAALERGRDERCIERLQQLAAAEPTHAEGTRIAAALGERLAGLASELVTRGEFASAAVLVGRARSVPFEACGAAVVEVAKAVDVAHAAERRRQLIPWAVAVLALLVALAALLSR